MTAAQERIWEVWVGSQTPEEFAAVCAEKGFDLYEAALDACRGVADDPEDEDAIAEAAAIVAEVAREAGDRSTGGK